MITTPAIIAIPATTKPKIIGRSAVLQLIANWPIVDGILAIIPEKIRREIPLPIPYSVISSPIHIKRTEPAVTTKRAVNLSNKDNGNKIPCRSKTVKRAKPWMRAKGTVNKREYWAILRRPASPSSWYISFKAGKMRVKSCMIIEPVINGPTPSIIIERLDKPPPEKMLSKPKNWLSEKNLSKATWSTPGIKMAAPKRKSAKIKTTNKIRRRKPASSAMSRNLVKNAFNIKLF